jgi:folate-binding protein YgfZ
VINLSEEYASVRGGAPGYYVQPRGLIAVRGGEAVQFLNGLITNDIAELEDGEMMYAAFPNAKGRLLAVVRVKRRGDTFLFETEEATYESVFQNLFRFTFAGDFHVEDLSEKFRFVSLWNSEIPEIPETALFGRDVFVPADGFEEFVAGIPDAVEISDKTYEVIRIEEGIPLYGKDMDDSTVVPEVGIEGLIHYQKGCYIGQEVIARIHFLGKPAKLLKGLVFETEEAEFECVDPVNSEGKGAGRITSVVFSPKCGKTIGLGYIRNAFSGAGTELKVGGIGCTVKDLPFIEGVG